jgi:hypothetical protein
MWLRRTAFRVAHHVRDISAMCLVASSPSTCHARPCVSVAQQRFIQRQTRALYSCLFQLSYPSLWHHSNACCCPLGLHSCFLHVCCLLSVCVCAVCCLRVYCLLSYVVQPWVGVAVTWTAAWGLATWCRLVVREGSGQPLFAPLNDTAAHTCTVLGTLFCAALFCAVLCCRGDRSPCGCYCCCFCSRLWLLFGPPVVPVYQVFVLVATPCGGVQTRA